MSIRATFYNTIDLAVINECDKGTAIRIQQCLGTFNILLVKATSEARLFRHLSDIVFGVRNFEKTKSMRVMFFFKIFKI